ncbi:MAG TPA: outer membrane protein assembly factor BamA [Burkholderiales bacterium]|nr:outer membrane protein assembly factor BamA [Burkholderiales bacterium]
MKKRYLPLALFTGFYSFNALAFEPFEVRDIRIEGIQRTEPGTVFSYLPIKVGDKVDEERAAAAVKALFATGFFKDVRLEAEGNVLVVVVEERPAIAQIDISGSKEFDKDKLKDALKQIGLAESRIFDRAMLSKAEQELKNQYISRGKYGVEITTTVTPLERNRVAINFSIVEGVAAKIRQIHFVGNHVFSDDELADQFVLRTPGLLTWYSKNDQYSKPKLEGDLETLRSFYLNQGYIEFSINSTQVSISPDKQDIYITVNLTEGKKYRVSDVKLAGDLIVPEEELKKLVKLKKGDVFSREKLTETTKLITDRLGDEGYAFAAVNAVPELDKEKREASFTLYVDPGRRVYVRRISISGNTTTRDEVIRRELRQMEGAWYSTQKLNRSRQRIDMLGFFSDVQIETPAVQGVPDQVDVNVKVTERATGNLTLGVGYSTVEKVILSAGISQQNIFGTGNALSFQVSTGVINQIYSVSYTNPYFTDDGVSRGFDVYKRRTDLSSLITVASYNTDTYGVGMRFGVPVTEYDTINYGIGFEQTTIGVLANTPSPFVDFVNQFGATNDTYLGTVGWTRDKRDSAIYPTSGYVQLLRGEVGLPIGSIDYYKASYQHQVYYPISQKLTLLLNGQLGYAEGYNQKPVPFYKNFFAGGVNSVRGYYEAGIGPKDEFGDALGGTRLMVGNIELLFPLPGLEKDKSVRLSTFVDGGTVGPSYDFSQMRYSTGLAFSWYSPVGPLKLSFGWAINPKPDDRLEKIQFTLGNFF